MSDHHFCDLTIIIFYNYNYIFYINYNYHPIIIPPFLVCKQLVYEI